MITAERLEELIKQGATIYFWDTTHINLINLNNRDYVKYEEYENAHYLFHRGIGLELSAIFETKDRAEWALKTTAERTDRFEPPMWEDIKDVYVFKFLDNQNLYKLVVNKNYNTIFIEEWTEFSTKLEKTATKENYIKACEIVRDLFNKGGAK